MPLVFDATDAQPLSLRDLQTFLDTSVDFDREASVASIAPMLQRVAADPRALFDHILDQLTFAIPAPDRRNDYTAQVHFLGEGARYFLRAVIWPAAEASLVRDGVVDLGYDSPHDHNFPFLTVGYSGPGYTTEVYEYDPASVIGYAGEAVELRNRRLLTLNRGRVLYFRPSRDVHVQLPPVAASVSLNVLLKVPVHARAPQNLFDYGSHTLVASESPYCFDLLFRAAGFVEAPRSAELLLQIAKDGFRAEIRLAAYRALAHLNLLPRSELTARMAADPARLIRYEAARAGAGETSP